MKLILVTLLALVASIQAKATPTDITTTTRAPPKDCTWDTKTLTKFHPLYVKVWESYLDINGFWLPECGNIVTVPHDNEVRLSCPGKELHGLVGKDQIPIIIPIEDPQEAILKCNDGSWMYEFEQQFQFEKLKCSGPPDITIIDMSLGGNEETCNVDIPDTKLLKIGFNVNEKFYTIIETCFNDETKDSIYSKNLLTRAVGAKYDPEIERPEWQTDKCYYGEKVNMDNKYICKRVKKTFIKILGSAAQVNNYVDCDSLMKLSRGHLTAYADLPYYPIRRTTFKFLNAAPQWVTVNSGNWNALEESTRQLVTRYGNLLVYSGTHGVTTLPADNNNVDKDLYLYFETKRFGRNRGDDGNDNEGGGNGNEGGGNGNEGGGNGNEGGGNGNEGGGNGNEGGGNGNEGGGNGNEGGGNGNEGGGNGNEGGGNGNEGGGNGNEGGGNGNEGGGNGNEGGGNGNEGGGNGNEGGGNGNEGGGNGNEGGGNGNEGGGNGNEGGGDSDTCDVKMDRCNIEYKIRVPEFYWRVVYDPRTKKGTAIVVMNNPHHKKYDTLCENVCDRIEWLKDRNWKPSDQSRGYAYCCEVGELSKKVKEIPKLEVDGLLI